MTIPVLSDVDFEGALLLGGVDSAAGQVPTSTGPGQPLAWSTPGGGFTIVPVTLSFGTKPVGGRRFVITTVTVSPSATVFILPSAANGDELEFDSFVASASVTAANQITAFIKAVPGPVVGSRTFDLFIK